MIIKFDDFDTRYRDYEPNAMAMVWLELFFQGPLSVLWLVFDGIRWRK